MRIPGLDHLLPAGRGAGGTAGEESEELKVACFMALVSYLASQPEVLKVAPLHKPKILNAVAKAIVQSATTIDTPLTNSGLDGEGEVIQVQYISRAFVMKRIIRAMHSRDVAHISQPRVPKLSSPGAECALISRGRRLREYNSCTLMTSLLPSALRLQ